MGNSTEVAARLDRIRQSQERSALWVARAARVPYKRVLNEIVHRTSPLKLDTAVAVSTVLSANLPELMEAA